MHSETPVKTGVLFFYSLRCMPIYRPHQDISHTIKLALSPWKSAVFYTLLIIPVAGFIILISINNAE